MGIYAFFLSHPCTMNYIKQHSISKQFLASIDITIIEVSGISMLKLCHCLYKGYMKLVQYTCHKTMDYFTNILVKG